MKYQREIEKKFVILDDLMTYDKAEGVIQKLHDDRVNPIFGTSFDQFWKADRVDFVRLRHNTNELTVKVTDRGTVTNRIEENVDLYEDKSISDCDRMLTLLFGPCSLTLEKHYGVYTIGSAIVSLYEVHGDSHKRLFVEAEADTMEEVDEAVMVLKKHFSLFQETRSLFQIFSERNKVVQNG